MFKSDCDTFYQLKRSRHSLCRAFHKFSCKTSAILNGKKLSNNITLEHVQKFRICRRDRSSEEIKDHETLTNFASETQKFARHKKLSPLSLQVVSKMNWQNGSSPIHHEIIVFSQIVGVLSFNILNQEYFYKKNNLYFGGILLSCCVLKRK